ncbi:hypothetical protein A3A70_00150 [candidate division WWE3 bacterium RIFCSPLOWO2_01_FULL_42_11]|uniref:LytR/CpsA/Psr regulator C-terminal domain-containing protein n=1 Tax=candidate division WWE3 bacterium RIFCSPLOWO2_01_FULL_42_11 TaxID=1802627 RepID=A0A1F4VMX2_UNCKA|nr:MAG: hypothetical protein A3A70_00150 [candidate division WWE3 bacterium RIFCSPLOWO2_01_FULL_42_11]
MQLSKVTIAALSISTLVIIGAISVVGYVYLGKTPDSSNTQNSSQDEDPSIKILKKYLDFPEENPTLTTITDPEKLKDEAFFKNALKGDQLFFFPKSGKAILFRPDTKHIIEMTNFTVTEAEKVGSVGTGTTNPSANNQIESLRIVILNGAGVEGLALQTEKLFTGKTIPNVKEIKVTEKANAAKTTYLKTVVVDTSAGKLGAIPAEVAKIVGGEVVTTLPDGEKKYDADLVIIVGKDKDTSKTP